MRPKSFLILSGITAVGIALAAGALFYESATTTNVQVLDEPMFPALVARANEVAKVTYRANDETATILLERDQWVLTDYHNYPVHAGSVRSVVAAIAALRRLEPKTDDPEKYERLEVMDVEAEGATSRELVLETADGTVLAAVILGQISRTLFYDPLGGMYVRDPREARSWLVRGTVAVPPTGLDWTTRQVVHLPGPDITGIVIREGDATITTEKEMDENGVMRYQLIPRDDEIRASDEMVKRLSGGVVSLNFDDVVPLSDMDFSNPTREIVFTADDGMTLTVQLVSVEDATWAKFDVVAEPELEGVERAEGIRSQTEGWAYLLPGRKARVLTRPLEELTEAIPPPEPEVAPGQVPFPPGFQLPPGVGLQIPGAGPAGVGGNAPPAAGNANLPPAPEGGDAVPAPEVGDAVPAPADGNAPDAGNAGDAPPAAP